MTNQNFLCYDPAVYVVAIEWVVIDGVRYTDNYAGVVRSSTQNHKVYVNQDVLDQAKVYTVVLALIPDRPPYFPKTTETFEREYLCYTDMNHNVLEEHTVTL